MTGTVHTRKFVPRRTAGPWVLCGLAVAVLLLAVNPAAWARYYSGFAYEYSAGNSYRPERLSREHRQGAELDDWLERGDATVTLSPAFDEGIRVAAWAQGSEGIDEYDFGIASAIYFFEIPERAREVKIRIRYEGEGRALDLGDEYAIAGRVWLRHAGPQPGPDSDEPLQGDTFVLRSDHRSEVIEVPVRKYVDNQGLLELHVVADGANRIDIDYIEVESYSTYRETRVVRRYVPGYRFLPWQAYTYHYYYGGPFFLMTDYGYYLHWDFPYGHSTYVGLRSRHHSYLHGSYRTRYPRRNTTVHYTRGAGRTRVNRWTGELQTTRSQYERGRAGATKARRAPAEAVAARQNVRTTLDNYRTSPSTTERRSRELARYRRTTASRRYDAPYAAAERSVYSTTKTRRTSRGLDTRLPQYRTTDTSPRSRAATDSTKRRLYPSTRSSTSAPRATARERASATPSRSGRSASTTRSRRSTTTERKKEAPTRSKSSSTKSKTTSRSKSSSSKDDDDDKGKSRRR